MKPEKLRVFHIETFAMALKDLTIRSAKPKESAYKLSDGGGLYLYVSPAGGKLWLKAWRGDGRDGSR